MRERNPPTMASTTQKHDKLILSKTANSLKAIAHPVRLAMVDMLKDGRKMTVTQIYETLGLDQAVASQHLSILRKKNIFEAQRKGKNTFYFLKNTCVVDAIDRIVKLHEPV